MYGFAQLLKDNFGDSATPLTVPLEPRLKSGQDAATAPPPPPHPSFDTPVGQRRVPRERDPKKPTYEMIKDARRGILSGFLRSGKIFRASDFVNIANPKTAIITLHDIYEFESRYLTTIDDQPISSAPLSSIIHFNKVDDKGPDDGKTLRTLFFITLAHDELPSFHFWTKPGDLDPVTAGEPIDWGKHFEENPPSPVTASKIEVLENERKDKVQRGAEEQNNTQNNQSLGFLDPYNNINVPGSGREPTQGQPADDFDSIVQIDTATVAVQSPLDAEVLLQFNRGGMHLREFTHKALYAMACWLVKNEEEEDEAKESPKEIRDMFLDILEPGKDVRHEKIVSVSRVSNRNFQENIKPILGRPDHKFRVRSTRYEAWWNLESGFDSGGVGEMKYDLKLVRPNVGYCYCSANWHTTGAMESNSKTFERALNFLFDWEGSAYPNSNRMSIDIPGRGLFDLDRDSEVVVDANIQKIFAELSGTSVKPNSHPVEIFVRDVIEDVTDGSELLGASSPSHGIAKYDTGSEEVPGVLQATEIRGGLDLPAIVPRLLTNSEINKLQERLRMAEACLVDTDDLQERLRIAEEKLSEMNGLKERLRISDERAKLKSSCPFCSQDWAGATKQQQQDHLKLHQKNIVHQPAPRKCPQPNCTSWLGENQTESTYEAISAHLRLHIEEEHAEDGICEHQRCHTNMYALTAEQQEEHESIHRHNVETEERHRLQGQAKGPEETFERSDRLLEQVGNIKDIMKKRDQLQTQVTILEDTGTDPDQLQQQVRHLQDAAKERDRLQEHLVNIAEERDSLQDRAVELERLFQAASGPNEGMQTRDLGPETEVDEDPKQPSQPEARKKLRYCSVCLKSVDKLSANAKITHADKCETSVSEFLLLTPAEAKVEREKKQISRDNVRPQAQASKEEEEMEVPNTGKKRKQKASAKSAPLEGKQDKAKDANTAQEPEASKATSRKTRKRKFETLKPPREDESEEHLESPEKKRKLKAKPAKADQTETVPTRRSTRSKDIHESADQEEDEDNDVEEAYDKPSSSAKGLKRKKGATVVTTVSKKAKTKK